MLKPAVAVVSLVLSFGPSTAGPCGQQIAELERALLARHEGAGTILSEAPGNESGAASLTRSPSSAGASSTTATSPASGDNQALGQLQAAKELDQRGQEAECMKAVSAIEAAPETRK